MTKRAAFLDDRGVVRVSGPDAPSFLQGLLTNDVDRLGAGEARYAALLSPQGKILFDLLVVRAPPAAGEFLLDCPAALAAPSAPMAVILPPVTPMSRSAAPSWLTTVAPARMQSNVRAMEASFLAWRLDRPN